MPSSAVAVIISVKSVFGVAALFLLGKAPPTLALAGGPLILVAIAHAA